MMESRRTYSRLWPAEPLDNSELIGGPFRTPQLWYWYIFAMSAITDDNPATLWKLLVQYPKELEQQIANFSKGTFAKIELFQALMNARTLTPEVLNHLWDAYLHKAGELGVSFHWLSYLQTTELMCLPPGIMSRLLGRCKPSTKTELLSMVICEECDGRQDANMLVPFVKSLLDSGANPYVSDSEDDFFLVSFLRLGKRLEGSDFEEADEKWTVFEFGTKTCQLLADMMFEKACLWSPRTHGLFPTKFRKSVTCLSLCNRRMRACNLPWLPRDILHLIICLMAHHFANKVDLTGFRITFCLMTHCLQKVFAADERKLRLHADADEDDE